jgi:dihydropteroate synthase
MFINVAQNRKWEINTPQIMGIMNVTHDSFYENSRSKSIADLLAKATQMIAEGALILDIGAQSTRPGAEIINTDTELANLIP